MKTRIPFPFLLLCLNTCHSQPVMQTDTYILPVDYIEYIDIDKSSIELNSVGLQAIKLVDFQKYSYFTVEKCKFKARILSAFSSLSTCKKINNPFNG